MQLLDLHLAKHTHSARCFNALGQQLSKLLATCCNALQFSELHLNMTYVHVVLTACCHILAFKMTSQLVAATLNMQLLDLHIHS